MFTGTRMNGVMREIKITIEIDTMTVKDGESTMI